MMSNRQMNHVLIDTAKTTDAIALILKLHQKPTILSQLLKMMYFIDRLYLAHANKSLTNDSYLCRKGGLIPKHIPDLILQLQLREIVAVSQIGAGYIVLNRDRGTNNLNILEQNIIKCIYEKKSQINPFNLLDWQYDLEFIKNHLKQHHNNPISPKDIMISLGKTEADIQAYIQSRSRIKGDFGSLGNDWQNDTVLSQF